MKKLIALLALVAIVVLGTGGTALADHSVYLGAGLNGASEVGAAGDPDGAGSAAVTIVNADGQICYDIAVSGIDTPSAAHIHIGGAGSNGDVVVNFDVAANGLAGCVDAPLAARSAIENTPSLYYVNVHNEAFPGGAIRGQLAVVDAPATGTTGGTGEQLAFTGTNTTGLLALAGTTLIASGALLVRSSRKQD